MKTAWTQHIKDAEEKTKFEESVWHNKWLLEHLSKLLDTMERSLNRQEISPSAYDQPNWEYRQAHANGYRQCLKNIQELITLDPKENK